MAENCTRQCNVSPFPRIFKMATDIPTHFLLADVQTNPSLPTKGKISYRRDNTGSGAFKPMPAIAPGNRFVRKLRGAVIIHLLLFINYSVVAESKPLIAASTAYQHKVADLILEGNFLTVTRVLTWPNSSND